MTHKDFLLFCAILLGLWFLATMYWAHQGRCVSAGNKLFRSDVNCPPDQKV